MSFRWRYVEESGVETGASEPFEDREAAEGWLAEEWRALLDRGVHAVVLDEEGQEVYRMGLGEG